MTYLKNLRVLQQATANAEQVSNILKTIPDFGDLHDQISRAALSVASNIAEGAGYGKQHPNQFKRYLKIARGSNNELYTQLELLSRITGRHIHQSLISNVNYTGKMISCLIKAI